MDENPPPNFPDPPSLVAVQERLSYQQRELDQLNAVVLQQQAELDRLRRDVARLTEVLGILMEQGGGDLPHEKPPHY